MFERIHNQIGTAGLIVAIVALVAAIGGSAVAATGGNPLASASRQNKKSKVIITKLSQIKPSVRNQLKGATGPAGPQGPAGANGKNGSNGSNGSNGESVKVSAYEGPECATEEGAVLSNATGTAFACNGEEGSPWTAGGTLPQNATETGIYAPLNTVTLFGSKQAGLLLTGEEYTLPVSFSLPLSSPPEFIFVQRNGTAYGTATGCPGVTGGIPEAASGKFCVYATPLPSDGALVEGIDPDSETSGMMLRVKCETATFVGSACPARGVWAVTG
jgi:hypothetical protein